MRSDGRLALDDPLGEGAAGPTGRGDPDRVEAGCDEEAGQLGRLAEEELVVGREALGSVVELADPRLRERRDPVHRTVHQDLEVLPVLVEQRELERVRDLRPATTQGLATGSKPPTSRPPTSSLT